MTRAAASLTGAEPHSSLGPPGASGAPHSPALPSRGAYARREVEVAALRGAGALELALAPPFGALFSALLPERAFRVRQLALDYVDTGRLGDRATFSAQVGDPLDGGQALELRLLVACGAWLCARGQALIELADPTRSEPGRGNGHG